MEMRCLACGTVKDTSAKEVYPYPDDGVACDLPIEPLSVMDCQGPLLKPAGTHSDWRVVIVCHHCFHKLEPDMWISDRCWESLNPVTPFERLPHPLEEEHPGDRFQVEAYARSL